MTRHTVGMLVAASDIARALKRGPATLDALAARTGAEREELAWALEEAAALGWVAGPADACGVCGDEPPAIYSLTDAGRLALSGA